MKRKMIQSTYVKMTMSFLLFGVLPLFILGMLFFFRYAGSIRSSLISNYTEMDYYFAKNMENIIESVDGSLSYLYEYSDGDPEMYLYEALENDTISEYQKNVYMTQMLQNIMQQSEYISSLRYVTEDGTVYSVFAQQGKTLQDGITFDYKEYYGKNHDYRRMVMLPPHDESEYCVNSDDEVFTIIRNYMDTRTIQSTRNTVLGTIYADINVEEVDELTENLTGGKSMRLYIINNRDDTLIYSSKRSEYDESDRIVAQYTDLLSDKSGNEVLGERVVFYQEIGTTGCYALVSLKKTDVLSAYFQNRTFMVVVLVFSAAILFLFYSLVSGRMSKPVRELKSAMQEVQKGNLSVQTTVKSGDEMEYLSEGFNKMVSDLRYYIEQVYVAQICQKDAELDALKMQIQPHFLYNTLDVIRMTALEYEDDATARLLESLSKQLHYVIGHHDDRVPLYKEIDNIREYFVIIKTRYEGRFDLHIDVADDDRDLYVLKLLIQPAIENAVKHGLSQKEGHGNISLKVIRQKEWLEILVMDDGVGILPDVLEKVNAAFEQEEIGVNGEEGWVHVGMKNSYDRICLNCGKEYGITVESMVGMGTIVKFKLPIWEVGESDVESNFS